MAESQAGADGNALKSWYKGLLDGERLFQVARRKEVPDNAGQQIETYARRIIKCAELLYDLAGRDDIWQHQLTD
jgi:hypothetical protein